MTDSLLGRVVSILEALVDAGEPVGPRALARLADVERSAVGRILQQLEVLDVLTGENGKYEPGPRLLALGRTLSTFDTLPTAATTVLASLVAQFDETSYVCMLHGPSVVFLYESQSSKPLRYVVELGRPVPLHAGAASRAILAGLPEVEAEKLLADSTLEQLTVNTVCDIDVLLAMRADDVKRGYTVSVEERVEGGAAVAAPFFDRTGQCQGSVVLTAPATRYHQMVPEEVGGAVTAAAASLSSRLGAPNN